MSRLTSKDWKNPKSLMWQKVDMNIKYAPYHVAVCRGLKKLAELEDLEEQNRLIELPCKVGDVVYCFGTFIDGIEAKKIVSISIEEDSIIIKDDVWDGVICEAHQIGKIVTDNYGCMYGYFLIKEEAEAKLAELKGE